MKALFQAAAERPAAERGAFLAAAAADDDALRREVESLLASDAAEFSFLDRVPIVAADVAALLEDHDAPIGRSFLEENMVGEQRCADGAGAMFGPYRLQQLLGEGGMGAVWLARQEHPIRRTVAVKVVKPGFDSREVLSRFESERQALAILNHQHIAKVFDAGVTGDGRPYFVMEHVEGAPITELADRHALTLQQRLELFLQVCDAVQHAHQKGVLHRDLKPGNILVCDQDGHLVAKVIDFGIAKAVGQHLTGDTLTTEFGVLVGTPEYMSPEQAGLVDEAVDTRTDIYSLGLVLYELLVGTPPFEARELRRKTVLEALRVIREDEPPRLATRLRAQGRQAADEVARLRRTETRTLLRQLHGDLEWITGRAIEKEPTRRYASVSELRADIGRYLQGEPVLAGPPSTLYRLRKLARRHRAAAAAVSIVAIAVTLSAIVSTLAFVRAVRAEDRTRRQLIGSLVAQGMQKVDDADPLTGLLYLIRALELETDPDRIRSHRIRIGETLQRTPRLVGLWRHDTGSHMLALSSRGLVATGGPDGVIKIRELPTGAPRGADLQQGAGITDGEFSSDGAALVVASGDGRVRLWDPTGGRLIREFVSQAVVADVACSPDGQLVAAIGTDGMVNVWDVRRGTLRFAGRHEGEGRRAVFSHSGAVLATAGQDGVRVWQVATGTPSDRMLHHDGVQGVTHIAFSRDDAWLASAGRDSTARLWDVRTMQQIGGAMRHDAGVTGVTFADESNLLVTTSIDRTTRAWRIPETSAIGAPRRSATVVQQPADVSRSLVIASPTQGGAVDLWSVDGERAAPSLPHGGQAMVRFEPTGRFLVTTADEGLARVWDLAPAMGSAPRIVQDEWNFHSHVVSSPDGRSVAVSSGGSPDRGAVRVFDVGTGAPITPAMRFWATSMPVAFSPDGRRLLTASGVGDVRLWDTRTGEPLTALLREQIPLSFAAFSPDGETFVVAGGMNVGTSGARVRRARDGAPRTELLPHDARIYSAWFSRDGRRLLTAAEGVGRNIKVWDPANGHLVWAARHDDGVHAALWSADGATVFTGGPDQWVRAWNGSSGAPQPPAIKMVGGISSVGVTRDGARLLSGTSAGDVRLVDLAHGGQVISAMWHTGYVYQSRFSPDGSLALTSASDRTVRLWDGRTGEPLSPNLPAEQISRSATFLAGGSALAWGGQGVFVDELTIDDRPIEELSILAESAAGRGISASGMEVALATEEVERRFGAANRSSGAAAASTVVDYQRARARLAWRRGAFEEVVGALAPLGAQGALNWPDFMRFAGAYAATSRWQDALGELRKYHARWQAAPELLYMEAVALARLRDEAGAVRHCRAALESTRNTQHPERAYWAARACLVSATVVSNGIAEIETRILLAYPRMSGNLGQAELRGAMLLRGGRSQEAFDLLKSAVPTDATVRAAVLLVASAAARAGLRVEALNWLKRADAIPKPAVYRHMRPWLDAEADALQEEVLSTLNRSSKIRTKSKRRSSHCAGRRSTDLRTTDFVEGWPALPAFSLTRIGVTRAQSQVIRARTKVATPARGAERGLGAPASDELDGVQGSPPFKCPS